MQSLRQSEIASISQWCLNEFLTYAKILETIEESATGKLDV